MDEDEVSLAQAEEVLVEKAKELVTYNDEQNHARHKYITGTHRGDRRTRDLLIDSSLLGWEKTAQYLLMLIEMLEEKEG